LSGIDGSGANDGPILGVQEPRISLIPTGGAVSESGRVALEVCRLAGLFLDPWQQLVLTTMLAERVDGKWAAFESGLVVPRQNGKGSVLEGREIAGLFAIDEERLIIHSAHEQATSSEHQRRLLELIEGVPDFEQQVLKAPRGKGSEAIELRDGSRILFKTRTGPGGRGLTGDLVVFDEAMILPVAATAALVPTMAARSLTGNPQLIYAGSAVDQQVHDHGIVLSRLRRRAIERVPRLAYFEWSADCDDPAQVPDDMRNDPRTWAVANPGMGIRISQEHIATECAGALGPREFCVERLGVGDWPDPDGALHVIDPLVWRALAAKGSEIVGAACFAFDVKPDRSSAAVAVGGFRQDGLSHVELTDHRPGTGWVAQRVVDLVQRYGLEPVCDGSGPAASLIPEIENLGVAVRTTSAQELARACGLFFDTVEQSGLRHPASDEAPGGAAQLATALKGAAWRPLGEARAWSRKNSTVDISPLVAVTLALWAAVEGGALSGGGFEWG
jgi:hypothetical protein